MEWTFIIKGRLPGMNEYTASCRRNPYAGAKEKRAAQNMVAQIIIQQIRDVRITCPVSICYRWYEQNKKRDHDNVSGFGHKVIQDALVECYVLQDDGWDEIVSYSDEFYIDKKNPRIEVTLTEVENG